MMAMVQFREAPVAEAQFLFERQSPTVPPFSSTYNPAAIPETGKVLTTPRFKIEGGEQRVVVEANAPVNNNWIGLDLDLVNAKTNVSHSGHARSERLSRPRQRRSLERRQPAGEAAVSGRRRPENISSPSNRARTPGIQKMPLTVRVKSGGIFNSNFLLMLGLVLLYPAFVLWRRIRFRTAALGGKRLCALTRDDPSSRFIFCSASSPSAILRSATSRGWSLLHSLVAELRQHDQQRPRLLRQLQPQIKPLP